MHLSAGDIQEVIPNRYPIYFIDSVEDIQTDKSIVAIKNVTANEWFVNSYLPDQFVMPSTLIIETLAQAASIFILKSPMYRNKTAYLGGITHAEFKKTVYAGDQLSLQISLKKQRQNIGLVSCSALVDGQSAVEAELMFIVEMV